MARWLFPIIVVAFFVATAASGWVHGSLVNRWGQAGQLQAAAAKLDRPLPERLGPWRLVKKLDLEQGVGEALQCAAHLQGIYTNEQTAETVVVAVLCGPSGPLSVHTPEICYSANDYEVAGEAKPWKLGTAAGKQHSFWNMHANSRHSTRPNLRVLYGWSQGGEWQAVRGPRFALAGLPVLYKLQLAGPARDNRSSDGPDPCQDFLARFVSEIQPRLVRVAQTASVPPITPAS
jgi:hypothetical protein